MSDTTQVFGTHPLQNQYGAVRNSRIVQPVHAKLLGQHLPRIKVWVPGSVRDGLMEEWI
jgi:hypothetical protein